jgi:hypothetical protein
MVTTLPHLNLAFVKVIIGFLLLEHNADMNALDNDNLEPTTGAPRRVVALGIFFSDTTQMSTFVIGVGTGINYGVAVGCRSSKQLIAGSRTGHLNKRRARERC